jgi:virulence factor
MIQQILMVDFSHMDKIARIFVIGNGDFANSVHYPSLTSLTNVEIVGICAFDKVRLDQTATKYNIPKSSVYVAQSPIDYQIRLMELKPDGVYVIGQPERMYDIWIWCLENRFNLFIEKPMGMTIHQSRTLAYLAKKNNCITQVSHQRRSAPIMQTMKDECLKKGQIFHALVEFYKYDIHPMYGAKDKMLDDFTHAVDTARWLCDGEVVKIESQCRRIIENDINCISSTLYFNNGATSYVVGNWTSGRRIFRAIVHAPGICAEIELEKEAYLYVNGNHEGERFGTKEVAGSKELFVYGGFQNKSIEFINSIITGIEKTSSPFSDVLKTMEICETILAQEIIGRT